jgi:phosphatidylglycerol:prolipoprotein diacylglycerol transferase
MDGLLLGWQFQSPGETLVSIAGLSIRWYGFLIAIAVLIGISLSGKLAKLRHIEPEVISDLGIILVLTAIPAARIYYVIFQWGYFSQHPQDIIAIWKGGIAIHGAIIGGTIASIIFAKLKKLSFWDLADVIIPSVALGQAIGRWGNFFNSEAFGGPTDLPWKLFIPLEKRPPQYQSFAHFHPTFLYESLWNLLIFSMLMFLFYQSIKRPTFWRSGSLFFIYMITYGMGRFFIEGLRTDSLMFAGLRTAQFVSVSGIVIGIIGLFWLNRKKIIPQR